MIKNAAAKEPASEIQPKIIVVRNWFEELEQRISVGKQRRTFRLRLPPSDMVDKPAGKLAFAPAK